MTAILKNDGFGRMTSYGRGMPPVTTEYREDGYYWAYPIHTSKGGHGKWTGPFLTRKMAEKNETS